MGVEIVQGTNQKPASSQLLVEMFSSQTNLTGHLFIGYPIINTSEGRHLIDAVFMSADKGIVLFDLIEGSDVGDYEFRQDDSANKLEGRLKAHRELMQRRDLLIPIHTISFAPGINNLSLYSKYDYPLVNSKSFAYEMKNLRWDNSDKKIYKKSLSVIESVSTIRKNRLGRAAIKENSRGHRLKELEDSIATLDNMQIRAVIETVEGVQRIRGLAGSGKTIVLALKAAYLHAQHPEWRIAVTFNTRSLKEHFHRLINNFSIAQTGEEPDWNVLRIVTAWGAAGGSERDGIYHEFCREHDIAYFDFGSARNKFGRGREFTGACEYALNQVREDREIYDVILLDEAQDFSPAFLRLCYESLKVPKRFIYAYDELQSLSGESLPTPEEIFGKKSDGSPEVSFNYAKIDGPQCDITLKKCYRNSRPVLVTAHALGFGIYREPVKSDEMGLIQMFGYPQLWEDVGYQSKKGELKEGAPITLHRTIDSSPAFLETHSPIDDLVLFKNFDDEESQAEWLANEIKRNLQSDELKHDDIIVINPDPLTTRQNVGPIRRRLLEMGIDSHLAGVDTNADVFFQPDSTSVTFTGIYRAKGNEAGMVYIINAQDCHSTAWNLASIRNRLFTAITRSKAWVRVLGVGSNMKKLEQEYEQLRQRDFELSFVYPTKEQRNKLWIIHRDMTARDRKRLKNHQKSLDSLIADIESGDVHLEDLDENRRAKLRDILIKKG